MYKFFNNNYLIVADYKPEEKEIFRSLPQICAYGILLRETLRLYGNISNLQIKCVGFSNKVAWEFSPEKIKYDIVNFIKMVNSSRKDPLFTKDNRSQLLDEFLKLI